MPPVAAPDRRTSLVVEAVGLVSRGGLQAVTHRSVETAADVPHGSVTYHFGGRDGLIAAVVEWLVGESASQVAGIAGDVRRSLSESGGELDVDRVSASVAAWIDGHRDTHLARLELELAAARDPEVRRRMTDAAASFWRLCEPLVALLGSPDPARDGRAMAAMVDGLLLDRLAHGGVDRAVVSSALRHLLASWDSPDG